MSTPSWLRSPPGMNTSPAPVINSPARSGSRSTCWTAYRIPQHIAPVSAWRASGRSTTTCANTPWRSKRRYGVPSQSPSGGRGRVSVTSATSVMRFSLLPLSADGRLPAARHGRPSGVVEAAVDHGHGASALFEGRPTTWLPRARRVSSETLERNLTDMSTMYRSEVGTSHPKRSSGHQLEATRRPRSRLAPSGEAKDPALRQQQARPRPTRYELASRPALGSDGDAVQTHRGGRQGGPEASTTCCQGDRRTLNLTIMSPTIRQGG